MTIETLSIKVEELTKKIDVINSSCCSASNIEQRVRTNILLESLANKMDTLVDEHTRTEITLNNHKRYIHYVIGAFFALQIILSSDFIKNILAKLL